MVQMYFWSDQLMVSCRACAHQKATATLPREWSSAASSSWTRPSCSLTNCYQEPFHVHSISEWVYNRNDVAQLFRAFNTTAVESVILQQRALDDSNRRPIVLANRMRRRYSNSPIKNTSFSSFEAAGQNCVFSSVFYYSHVYTHV